MGGYSISDRVHVHEIDNHSVHELDSVSGLSSMKVTDTVIDNVEGVKTTTRECMYCSHRITIKEVIE